MCDRLVIKVDRQLQNKAHYDRCGHLLHFMCYLWTPAVHRLYSNKLLLPPGEPQFVADSHTQVIMHYHIMQFSQIQALVINHLILYPLGCRGGVWVELRVREGNFLSGVIFHCSNSANLFLSWSIVFQPMTIWRDMSRWARMSRGRDGSQPPLLCTMQANWNTVVVFMVFVTQVPIISDSVASSLCDVPPLGSELCNFWGF